MGISFLLIFAGITDPLQLLLNKGESSAANQVEKSHSFARPRAPSYDTDSGLPRNNLMPLPGDVPKDLNVHLIELEKKEKAALGISLVPSYERCEGFFQVSFTQIRSPDYM